MATPEDLTFDEIYQYTVDENNILNTDSVLDSEEIEEFQSYDDTGEMMEDLHSLVAHKAREFSTSMVHSSQAAEYMKKAVHNDLGFSSDEIRVITHGAEVGLGTYNAVFRKNDEGDWVKDLSITPTADGDENTYVRHDEPEREIDMRSSSESGLWYTWHTEKGNERELARGINHARNFFLIDSQDYNDPEVPQEDVDGAMFNINLGSDSIVVDDVDDEVEVGYEREAARKYALIANFHMNDNFNDEMAIIEEATEAYHNNPEPCVNIRLENDELTAEPSEEYIDARETYNVKDIERA